MQKPANLLDGITINWNAIRVNPENTGWWGDDVFEITPIEYLEYARADYNNKTNHGYINCISNAKRAIDCKIDTVIRLLGYDEKNLKINSRVIEYINKTKEQKEIIDDNPIKVKFLESINLAPQFIINKIRDIRNKAEHEYTKVEKRDAIEAIEICELFIKSVDHKLYGEAPGDFKFGSDIIERHFDKWSDTKINNGICVEFKYNKNELSHFNLYRIELFDRVSEKIKITGDDEEYIDLLMMFLYGQYERLSGIFGLEKAINYEVVLE